MHIQKRKIYEEYSITHSRVLMTVSVELELVGQVPPFLSQRLDLRKCPLYYGIVLLLSLDL